MFAHVDLAGFDSVGVVDDAVHDRVGVDPAAEALVPVLLRLLGAEHRRGRVVAPFEELATVVRDMSCAAICRPVSPSARNRSTSFALILRTIRITPSAA